MKKETLIFLFLTLVTGFTAYTQEVYHTTVTSFSIRPGFSMIAPASTIEDYNNLKNVSNAPSSLFIDATQFSVNTHMGASGNAFIKVDVGLTPYCKRKNKLMKNREIRFSIGLDAGVRRNFMFYKIENLTDDTVFNSQGVPIMVQYNTSLEQHDYSENFVNLMVGASYLFKTDPKSRFYLYAGAGVEYAVSMRNTLSFLSYSDTTYEYRFMENDHGYRETVPYNYYYNPGVVSKYKMHGVSHFIRGFVPAGIDFRISNGNNFFKQVHLFMELQPGVEFQLTNGVAMVNPYFGLVVAGFSYKW